MNIYVNTNENQAPLVRRPDTDQPRQKKRKTRHWLRLVIVIIIFILVVIGFNYLMKGSSSVRGEYPANVKNHSLVCTSKFIKYKKITEAESNDTSLDITMIFKGREALKSISLTYTLGFADAEEVKKAETFSHAEFNFALADDGYAVDKFSNKFSRYDDRLIISLFANGEEINEKNISYFSLNDKKTEDEDDDEDDEDEGEDTAGKESKKKESEKQPAFVMPVTLDDYYAAYAGRGFKCSSSTSK